MYEDRFDPFFPFRSTSPEAERPGADPPMQLTHRDEDQMISRGHSATRPVGCPEWCVVHHDIRAGEEDWLHVSEPLYLTEGVAAQLSMSLDPATGEQDGPFVTVGDTEYTLEEAVDLGVSITAIAEAGGAENPCRPLDAIADEGPGTRSPGP